MAVNQNKPVVNIFHEEKLGGGLVSTINYFFIGSSF